MEKQKTEEYCLKANSIKEAVQVLNTLPLSEKEKAGAIVFGTLMYDLCLSFKDPVHFQFLSEASDGLKKAYIKMRLKEILYKYIHKKEKSLTGVPEWVSVMMNIYHSLESNSMENTKQHKSK